jgi:outer membrane receptor protein involved in Fe transport
MRSQPRAVAFSNGDRTTIALFERKARSPVATAVAAAIAAAQWASVAAVAGASMVALPVRAEAPATGSGAESGPPQSSDTADQQQSSELDEVVVTATRRAESIQKIPFNISAIDGAQISAQGLSGLTDLLRQTPGVFAQDAGRGEANEIVARGLSVGGTAEPGWAKNDTGGVVSTYVGEIPVFVDLRLTDLERVEVLLGPQGTLYGAGTLGGAIRYIPRKPRFDAREFAVRGDTYGYSESNGIGTDTGLMVNLPISENMAFRANVDYLHDPGFVDDNFIVRSPGVSDIQPDFTNPSDVAANLRRVRDANKERTLFAHAALRWQPVDAIDATLNFYFQDQEVDAGTENHAAAMGTGRYESAVRFLEYENRRNKIGSLEVTADLGFAELTSATGYTKYNGSSLQDLTDLLLNISLSYAAFPNFADFSPWKTTQKRFSQELRLVSKGEGPFGWIAGAFYDKKDTTGDLPEYAPGFSQFALDNLGWAGVLRPDAQEYDDQTRVHQKEKAVFGELSYKLTDAWKVVGGARWYDYNQSYAESTDAPMYYTSYFDPSEPDWRPPNEVLVSFTPTTTKDSGYLFKFSTSYEFTNDLMAYFTRSEGYRIGSSNAFPLCDQDGDGVSDYIPNKACAGPGEEKYLPDKTVNYELGLRSQWLDHRLTVNGSIYYIDWQDPQLAGATAQGAGGITTNGKGARSEGVDLAIYASLTDRLRIAANYSFTDAKLTDDARALMHGIYLPGEAPSPDLTPADIAPPDADGNAGPCYSVVSDGEAFNPDAPFATKCYPIDGKAGDRLPHSPRHQGSLSVSYTQPVGQRNLVFHYGITALSSVLTTVGGRNGGETLGGYALHSASVAWESERWTLSLYGDNLFNKFAKTDTSRSRRYIQAIDNYFGEPIADPVRTRNYRTHFVTPLQFGLRFTYHFGL